MGTLIDAEIVWKEIYKLENNLMERATDGKTEFEKFHFHSRMAGLLDALYIIQDAHAVDAVPVVRCKDCKYGYIGIDDSPCDLYEMPLDLPGDFFCASGERRKDERPD